MTAGPWLGTVTRVDGAGRPFVRVERLMGGGEYGPLLCARDRVRVQVPIPGAAGTASSVVVVEGAPVYQAGDTVLLTDVADRPSVYVVLGRVG